MLKNIFCISILLGFTFCASAKMYSDVNDNAIKIQMKELLKNCNQKERKISCLEKKIYDYAFENMENERADFIARELAFIKESYLPMYQDISSSKQSIQYYDWFLQDTLFSLILASKQQQSYIKRK